MKFQLHTLGTLRLTQGDVVLTGPAVQRRRLALLALLASTGERGLTRDRIVGYLWPEQTAARGRHLLSEAIYVLRKVMGEASIIAQGDDVRLNHELVGSDVARFRAGDDHDDLYHGPFLDGIFLSDAEEFERWVESERAALAAEYARRREQQADERARVGDVVGAARIWQSLAQHEPFSNRVALRYMQALADAGDSARAIEFAASFNRRLRDELDMDPDQQVLNLVAKLQRAAPSTNAPAAIRHQSDPDDPLGLASLAPEFDVVRPIGTGSVSEVFLARETSLRRLVAIKVLRPHYAQSESARKRFEREAQSAARVDHPNVAGAFRFGRTHAGVPYIVMPFLDGGSLEDRLAATGPWSIAQSRAHLAQIAGGLAAAHRAGIVHRDVRPGNILYYRDSDRPIITDFGLATILDSGDAAAMRLTMPGEQLGVVAYSSPEQLKGEPVTERADVYSLGVVAFEMATGEFPWEAKTSVQMLHAQATQPPRQLHDVAAGVDRSFSELVARCLQTRPERRPSARELEAAWS